MSWFTYDTCRTKISWYHRTVGIIGQKYNIITSLLQEDSESRLAVQESLSLMSSAYSEIDQSACKLMEALIVQNIEKVGHLLYLCCEMFIFVNSVKPD
jgi:hypothetical protein